MDELRIRLEGDRARLGHVAATDVARLILLVEKAAASAAAVLLGHPKVTTGRHLGAVEHAVHMRLLGVEEGSVVPVLQLPGPSSASPDTLDLGDMTLGCAAVNLLLDAERESDSPPDPTVARALLDVADGMHLGERYDAVVFDAAGIGRTSGDVRVDSGTRKRLHRYMEQTSANTSEPDQLTGLLVAADFEHNTARLRTAAQSVEVSFSDRQADEIHAALRQQATARGEVTYDRTHSVARSVRLTQLVHGEQLLLDLELPDLDSGEFWRSDSIDDLARAGATRIVSDPADLYDAGATDDERDAFMDALAEYQR